jgi:hypothetical protein
MDICHACARSLPQSDFKRFAGVEGNGLRVWALNPFQYRGWDRIRVVRAWGDQGPAHFSKYQNKAKINFTNTKVPFRSVDLVRER